MHIITYVENWVHNMMRVDKDQFDTLLQRLLKQKPEKTQEIKGTPQRREPIIPKPRPSEPR
jgi:exopolyphosphatase/pppGpp-phosphohydrolase